MQSGESYKYAEVGHAARDRRPKDPEPVHEMAMMTLLPAFVTVPNSPKSRKWMLDLGHLRHITNDQSHFIDLVTCTVVVKVGNIEVNRLFGYMTARAITTVARLRHQITLRGVQFSIRYHFRIRISFKGAKERLPRQH